MTNLTYEPNEHQSSERDEMLAAAKRYAMPGFDVEIFWEHMIEHLDAPLHQRLLVLYDFAEGDLPPRRLLDLQQEVEQMRAFWNRHLGVELADLLRRKLARNVSNPRDTAEVLAQRSGDPDEDAALLLYVFLRETGGPTPREGERRLREAAALGPRLPSIWVGLANGLMMLAREHSSKKVQKRLFAEVARWLEAVLERAPENPEVLNAYGDVLVELAVLSGAAKCRHLLLRSQQAFVAAGRSGTKVEGTVGRACVAVLLQATVEDETQKRQQMEEAHHLLREAVAGGIDEPRLHLLLAQTALGRGWLPEAPEVRRALFEEACDHCAMCSEVETLRGLALAYWGCAIVGLAALSPQDERKRLTAKAVDLFRRADEFADESAEPHPKASSAWLQLMAESTGKERRDAGRLAADAARRLNQTRPGEGDYELACALSLLEEHAEAAGWLISALKHDPSLVGWALEDTDLLPLWKARPRLRQRVQDRHLAETAVPIQGKKTRNRA